MSQPKKINVRVIKPDQDEDKSVYDLLVEIREKHHPDLGGAAIVLAWGYEWHENTDNHLKLGECRRATDLDHQLHGWDFVVVLNYEAWHAAEFSREQMAALLDHELSHAALALDENGEPREDEDGRQVWRIRDHDIEEFTAVVARHGLWRADLEAFAKAAMESGKKV